MTVWFRAEMKKDAHLAFSGHGGLYTAGRWNHKGRKVIYCSESIALCTLEWLAHQGIPASSFAYYRYSIEVPNHLTVKYVISDLPKKWNATPSTQLTRDFAEKNLFSSMKHLAMVVPSVMVPEEYNLILNPEHDAFIEVSKTIKCLGEHAAPSRQNKS